MAASGWTRAACALVLLLLPPAARAQAPAAVRVRSRLVLEVAAAHASVLDPVASPLRYTGAGAGALLGYRRETPGGALELAVELQADRLDSGLSDDAGGPHEDGAFGAVTARLLRRVAGRHDLTPGAHGTALLLGAEARLDLDVRDHFYSLPALDFGYGLALATLAPAARLQVARGRAGELRADLAAPLLGVALRPYGDLAYVHGGLHPRLAAPPALAGLGVGIGWAVPLGATRARLLLDWRLDALRYREADRYRAAHQRLGLGLELPLGGGG